MFGTKILDSVKSKFNGNLRVVKSLGLGTYIQANGLTQSGGVVETIWKSTLGRVNQISKNKVSINDICILGVGGGTLIKLLRKKYKDSNIIGYEIDEKMISLGKRYLNLDDYNADIRIEDVNNVKLDKNSFDLLIVDMYSGDNFPKEFEDIKFLNKIKNSVKKNGLIVINRLYYGDKRPDTVKFGHKLEKIFKIVTWHYPVANLMFICEL